MKLEYVKEYFKTQPLMYLATIEDDQPRVRPMALIYHKGQCWCCTISGRSKIEQIKKNNKVEFALNATEREDMSTIRGLGKAVLIEDPETKKELSEAIPWFSGYWKAYNDPNFILYRLDLDRIEVQIPEVRQFYLFDLVKGTVKIKEE